MKKSILIVAVLAISILLAACGSGGAGANTTIETKMTDFKFDPAEWTVPAGKEITFNIRNDGAVVHEWALMLAPVTQPFDENDEGNVIAEFSLDPGKSEAVKFTAPSQAGDYQVVCGLPGHTEAGMVGTLHVVQQ